MTTPQAPELPDKVRRNTSAALIYKWLPCRHDELKARLGVGRNAVASAVALLKKYQLAHISGWASGVGTLVPLLERGNKEDARRPTKAELARARVHRYREANLAVVKAREAKYRADNAVTRAAKATQYRAENKAEIALRLKLKSQTVSPKTVWVTSF